MLGDTFFYWIGLGEYLVALVGFLIICMRKLTTDRRKKIYTLMIGDAKKIMNEVVQGERSLDEVHLKRDFPPMPELLSCVEAYEKNFSGSIWQQLKSQIFEKEILTWARSHLQKKGWSKNNEVGRAFLLCPLKRDLAHMQRLCYHKDFYIRMLGIEAIGKLKLAPTIPFLIDRMQYERHSARFPYRCVLMNMPLEHFVEVNKVYVQAFDDALKEACLDIMSHRFYGNVHPLIQRDIHSPNPTIRFYIAEILGNIHTDAAKNDLILMLADSDPKVLIHCMRSLSTLKIQKAFERIALLIYDKKYSVRLEAAFSLMRYGKAGQDYLEKQDWDLEPKAYEVARYVLTLPKEAL